MCPQCKTKIRRCLANVVATLLSPWHSGSQIIQGWHDTILLRFVLHVFVRNLECVSCGTGSWNRNSLLPVSFHGSSSLLPSILTSLPFFIRKIQLQGLCFLVYRLQQLSLPFLPSRFPLSLNDGRLINTFFIVTIVFTGCPIEDGIVPFDTTEFNLPTT